MFPTTRLRRLRRTEAMRAMVRENQVTARDLILPIFVDEAADEPVPIASMPGVARIPLKRLARDGAGFERMPIMSYSTKFASAFYGPFRAAAGCDLQGDRKTYQADPMNGREALRESEADEAEGADWLMVKPGMPYLDVLSQI